MGTRGFYIYRYNGRYYVYYNHWDSYPEGLGSWIVEDIPTDPDEYRAWLNRMRATYAELDKILEEQILTVSDADLKACADLPHKLPGQEEEGQYRPPKRDVLINEKLEYVPSVLPDAGNDLFIEWVYTIDLDREVFSVDNGAHFHLDKIPRDDAWIKAVAKDANGLRTLDTEVVPRDCAAHPILTPILPDPSLLNAYGNLTTIPTQAKTAIDLKSELAHNHLIRLFVWSQFSRKYGKHLPHFLYGWEPQEFVFREFVYAILTLASGDPDTLRYMPSENLQLVPGEGYRWFEGKDGKPILLPVFMEACHRPGIEPGISPADETLYWFGGVVIYLTVRLNSDDHRKAAIARAVAFGRESDRGWFDAVIISIEHVVLLRLLPGDMVEHTDAIPLFSIPVHTSMHAEHRPAARRLSASSSGGDSPARVVPDHCGGLERDPVDETAEALEGISPGFVALIHLFDGAAYSQLKPLTSAKEGIFPTEIMHMILPYTDDETYHKCEKVSRGLRHFCQRNLRVFEGYTVLNYKPPMNFAILNRTTGVVEHFHLCVPLRRYEKDRKTTNWCPVIGAIGRIGFLTDVEIFFTGLAAQSHDNIRVPLRMVDNAWRHRSFDSNPYLITRHQSVGVCLLVWERYLGHLFPIGNGQVMIRRESHDYHFPPNTGVIYLHSLAHLVRSEKQAAKLWVWLKRPSDDRTEIWERSVKQAGEMLEKLKVRHSMWFLLAFGNKVRAFRWEAIRDAEPGKYGAVALTMPREHPGQNVEQARVGEARSRGPEIDVAEQKSESEAKGSDTTPTKAKQTATANHNLGTDKPEARRGLTSKLGGRTLNITVKEDSGTIEAFLRNIQDLAVGE
ncbi:MAG: hypothetical protein M1839_004804 [Geoglossum umbratile]|nr:MAG: hypothetical protein M1839_004804 [Geoglossum umbratile]